MRTPCQTIKKLLIAIALCVTSVATLAMPKAAEDDQSSVTSAPDAARPIPAKNSAPPVLAAKNQKESRKKLSSRNTKAEQKKH